MTQLVADIHQVTAGKVLPPIPSPVCHHPAFTVNCVCMQTAVDVESH